MRLPRSRPLTGLALLAVTCLFTALGCGDTLLPDFPQTVGPGVNGAPGSGSSNDYLFCFWNVENLFDDVHDGRTGPGDKEYDGWLAANPEILRLKLFKLTEALMKLNHGRGPDILALVEVENVRAAALLQAALNSQIVEPRYHYSAPIMKEVSSGRHIAPVILTRLPVVRDRTRNHGNRLRIIEGHVIVDNHELVVLASHWSSRLRDTAEKNRSDYADKLYGAASAICQSNPKADILLCGDFNDTPKDESVVSHLHATGDVKSLRAPGPLRLLNLMADKDPSAGFGTYFYNGKWFIFDHLVVSPGMVDTVGWSCDPASTQTIVATSRPGDSKHRPWRFGGENEKGPRGYSDHFPVTVKLKVVK